MRDDFDMHWAVAKTLGFILTVILIWWLSQPRYYKDLDTGLCYKKTSHGETLVPCEAIEGKVEVKLR